MKGFGLRSAAIVAFLLLTLFYLFPTVRLALMERNADSLPEADRAFYLEQNRTVMEDLREQAISLGLDLKGGMHVSLEVGTAELMLELAGEYGDDTFESQVAEAEAIALEDRTDIVDEFVEIFTTANPEGRLSRYFRSDAAEIGRTSTNEEIVLYLKTQRDAAVDRAMEIVRNRVDRFGVTEPAIYKQGANRIVVELPGVDDKERVRNLLKGTARLEFRLAADGEELIAARERVYDYFQPNAADSASGGVNLLNDLLILQGNSNVVFGYAAETDIAEVNEYISEEEVQRLLPRNTTLLWAASEFAQDETNSYFELIGVRSEAELTGDVITEASVQFDPVTNIPEVSMSMNTQGARTWSRITGANINKPIAIVLDGVVYSYPVVQNKISNGQSSINGLADLAEAEDLVNILLSGALPAPLEIIEEQTVGATLGEASIRAGLFSIVTGLTIVALFMMVYYRGGGAVADLALLVNIIFILGILAAFKATLTLPGIAGIVLTIGMAVDANVLIFDRIREEMRLGKTLKAGIESGYNNALSAILDANVTTFFVGVILYSFGVGPIKGFAVTLMAGIASSLFSALILSRVLVENLAYREKSAISFG
ncbi:MAG TPA: protein translocase subunit SecD [Bacteroidetes bacterium]|nr:MAG: protein translocase subunit SecD [Rhodothermaceae bacterium TMED105]HBD42453.1 protein translocase subunit SecD [Bacteroidota bacterium]|tara:strand:+ start:19795 stop:21594 length:1800 start_codon:yes stop_codon:yes gene_type:complete